MASKLKEVPTILTRNFIAGVNTMLRGKPALGKTATINVFVERMQQRIEGFKCWTFYAPTMSPMDIQASAPNYETGKLQLFNNAALPNAYDDPDVKGVVFFGEFPNADTATAKLLQKYVNGEDMSGSLRKPVGVVVIADGNRIEDKSGVQQQGRALLSRFEQIDVYSEAQDNQDYAAKSGWHPNVQTFFKDNPQLIDNYDEVFETSDSARSRSADAKKANGAGNMSEEGKQGIWANMRSWERISKKEFAAEELGSPITLSELAGNLGTGVAAQYNAHCRMLASLTSFEDIMADPKKALLPTKMDEQYALSMIVAMKCQPEQMQQVHDYCTRMPLEMQAVVLRTLVLRKGFNLAGSPVYPKWISSPGLVALLQGKQS
jgi:hypothetical protein